MPPLYEPVDQKNGVALGGGVVLAPGHTIDLPEHVGDACSALRMVGGDMAPPDLDLTNDDLEPHDLDVDDLANDDLSNDDQSEATIPTTDEAPKVDTEFHPSDDTTQIDGAHENADTEKVIIPDDLTTLPYIGKAANKKLNDQGIVTFSQVVFADPTILMALSNRIKEAEVAEIKAAAQASIA